MQHVTFEPKEFERELRVVRRELADGEVDRQPGAGQAAGRDGLHGESGPAIR